VGVTKYPYYFKSDDMFYPTVIESIYLEIIKYSSLIKRAKERKKIFMEKLGIAIDYNDSTN
jgi:hypothetical protein